MFKEWIGKLFKNEIIGDVETFLKSEIEKIKGDFSAELDKIPGMTPEQKQQLLQLLEQALLAALQAWIQAQVK